MGKQPAAKPADSDRQAKIDAAAKANATGPNKILIGTVVALIAIIAVVAGVIIADQSTKSTESTGGNAIPAAAGETGAGFVANEGVTLEPGAPTLDIYEDFRCPACHRAYAVFHPTVSDHADQGKIKLVYHFKAVIDSQTRTDESVRAASSAMCAADAGRFTEYHEAIMDDIVASGGQQPEWTPATFTAAAEQAGITGPELETFDQCVADGSYERYIRSVDEQSARDGVTGTPLYKLNGEDLDFNQVNSPELLTEAIANATE
ncbi:MAG: DsbA family protein [Dermatophilaceae bacterium]|nr:DsbA family protein [Intrasporangiaceae bacterium]